MENEAPASAQNGWLLSAIGAACFTILAGMGIWEIFILGEETARAWFGIAVIPGAAYFWSGVVRHIWPPVFNPRLETVGFCVFLAVMVVGWLRTGDVLLVVSVALGLGAAMFAWWKKRHRR